MTVPNLSVTLANTVAPSSAVMVQEVGGELVLLDLASEQYFGLDPVGTRIWKLLGTHGNLQSVRDCIHAEFDAPLPQIEHDLLALVQQLVAAGLVTVQ